MRRIILWVAASIGVFTSIYAGLVISGYIRPERPSIAMDLPPGVDAATAEFSNRLAIAFPAGTLSSKIRSALTDQGFRGRTDVARMFWGRTASLFCEERFSVDWLEEGGLLTAPASGQYGLICL